MYLEVVQRQGQAHAEQHDAQHVAGVRLSALYAALLRGSGIADQRGAHRNRPAQIGRAHV